MDKYKLVGPAYDYLSKLYSGDAIRRCKLSMLRADTLSEGANILIAGAGQGDDVIHAARLGAHVTVVELSPTMFGRLEKRLSEEPPEVSGNVDMIQGDILKHERYGAYDVVVSNFFLNVFDRSKMELLLSHLCKHCRHDGQIIIGDFKPLEGSAFNKLAQNAYWYAAACSFFVVAGNAVHQIYDYLPMLNKRGFALTEELSFSVAGKDLYYSLRAHRAA